LKNGTSSHPLIMSNWLTLLRAEVESCEFIAGALGDKKRARVHHLAS